MSRWPVIGRLTEFCLVRSWSGERDGTARTHAGGIQEDGERKDFSAVSEELSQWLDARAWTTGDGPKALFDAASG